ncbi:unnamed protein product [[Actinomadura] parvosata subsp. kistnae]|uniref:Uncharacterized protein n=1 Tax=[Actinomadura] parvosata subsp. kistnae TaxID=1909395 RepID=A0A1U9ZUE9_9ACTN|nr:hypothetical protein [Nonomuraea sp. ATCC 55076]AQZ61578.1 hypothetical protein BKM31_08935 [Nonomuraea sp. ATCC 55076]SPL87660.1 unnamed protein product [Actinomadura parvosata subsp. kistnae]
MNARTTLTAVATALSLSLLASGTAAAASATPPDPAPGGPQRPHEPDVAGTRNIDSLSVTATRGPDGRSLTIAFDRRSRAETGQVPAGARRFVFLFDRSVRFNPEAFPTCSRTLIEQQGVQACPEGSRIGGGRGEYATGEAQEVLAFNTRIGPLPGVLVVLPASGVILEQTLERVSVPYQRDYRWALDEILPPTSVPPQERAGTVRFQLSFGATRHHRGRLVGFAETSARPGSVLGFGLWSEFVTGQVVLPTARTPLVLSTSTDRNASAIG